MAAFAEPPPEEKPDAFERMGKALLRPFLLVGGGSAEARFVAGMEDEHKSSFRGAGVGVSSVLGGSCLTAVTLLSQGPSRLLLASSAVLIVSGAGLLIVALVSIRVAAKVRSTTIAQVQEIRSRDPVFRDVESIRAERSSLDESLFRRNLGHAFLLKSLDWRNVSFFEDGTYRFAPRVNVLLGKNGYGKTLLFRTLVAMVQRDGEYSRLIIPSGKSADAGSLLGLEVLRNGTAERIARDATYFNEGDGAAVGKIPMLSIPDTRFVNRTRRTVSGATGGGSLSSDGSRAYLTQEPFEDAVQDLLTRLCLDFIEAPARKWSSKSGFDRAVFRLVEGVVRQLTENEDFGFSDIRRVGTSGFEILVTTSGNPADPIPIQSASQGTLSVVAIFGLIYGFLHSLRPDTLEDEVASIPGIVLIDEIDAHLHPSWQQKIMGMLTSTFPNVQFIVSAHSPAIVAGCDAGEVAVIRRAEGRSRFSIYVPPGDFLGMATPELYRRVFEIEDVDRLYREYTAESASRHARRADEIARLEDAPSLSPREEQDLERLLREHRLAERALQVRDEKLDEERNAARVDVFRTQVEDLEYKLGQSEGELARLRLALAEVDRGAGRAG